MGATMAQARCRRLPDRPPTTRISNKFEDKGSFVRELFRRIKTTFIMVAIVALGSWFIQTNAFDAALQFTILIPKDISEMQKKVQ
jgi:hypothetical protein